MNSHNDVQIKGDLASSRQAALLRVIEAQADGLSGSEEVIHAQVNDPLLKCLSYARCDWGIPGL